MIEEMVPICDNCRFCKAVDLRLLPIYYIKGWSQLTCLLSRNIVEPAGTCDNFDEEDEYEE